MIEVKETKVAADKSQPSGMGNKQGGSYLAESGLYGNGINAEPARKVADLKHVSASQVVAGEPLSVGGKAPQIDK